MKKALLLLMILLATGADGSKPRRHHRRIACKTAATAKSCYWARGRLQLSNGTPAYRLWKVGTVRLLGIYSGSGSEKINPLDNENPELPAELRNYEPLRERVYADFEVCPLEPEKKGKMQAACIESARNVVFEKH